MASLKVDVEQREGQTRVVLAGELDIATSERLERELALIERNSPGTLVLDMRQVEFIDSTGLSVLLNGLRRVTRVRGAMAIACANPTVLRLFEITKLDSTFDILPDCDQAIERIRQIAAD